ncbi:hypothetical protein SAMN05216559_3978 [Halomicrobium zhouii]|uniref:DUF1850 domain-containing protein n=1 Tax=Halomicrobium zhouii TaxID=767519 RepID=A0A1I6M8E2_9EURY|nr:DUF1850 domain-containing protein [Halomicrobium zhouii]SFS11941.1 hypothetical protein SAMN05216559_3978 [Halomicrobium zhouii]
MVRTGAVLGACGVLVIVVAAGALGAAGVGSAVSGALDGPAERTLVVADVETGERYLSTPVENGTTVALEYTHSVEKSRVYDEYTVRGDRLEMTRMEFESYGWGLPADANVTLENGTFVYDPDGNVSELTVKPGRVAGHRLHVGDRTYDLVNRTDARSVRIHVTNRSTIAATFEDVLP